MVQPNFKLHFLEVLDFSGFQLFVIDWHTAFEATTGIEPTILIQLRIMAHFNEHADLCHNHVTETNSTTFNINTTDALFITFLLILLPNIKVYTVCGIVTFPLGSTWHSLVALRHVPDVQVAVVLVPLFHGGPRHAHAHDHGVAIRHLIRVEINRWERHVLCSVPLVKLGELIWITHCLHVIINIWLPAIIVGVSATNKLHPLEQEIVLVHVRYEFHANLNLVQGASINNALTLMCSVYFFRTFNLLFVIITFMLLIDNFVQRIW